MVKISWTQLAVQDLEDIREFIAQDSERYAIITVNKIFLSADNLLEYPEIGRIVPEIATPRIRELIIGNYRLIYHLKTKEEISVLRIYSSWRHLSKKKLK